MATGKVFYWFKLNKDAFENGGMFDNLMQLPDGEKYVIIFQMLTLATINTDGVLGTKIGDEIVPYDEEKIRQICKYFSKKIIKKSLKIFKKMELISEEKNEILEINNFGNMVGKATDYALQKEKQRKNNKEKADIIEDKKVDTGVDNVHIEIRDNNISNYLSKDENPKKDNVHTREEFQTVINKWHDFGFKQIENQDVRFEPVINLIQHYGLPKIVKAMQKCKESKYLRGEITGLEVDFDWFINPKNFVKILEGKFDDRPEAQTMPKGRNKFGYEAQSDTYKNFDEDKFEKSILGN